MSERARKPATLNPGRILVIGSGALQIGQAGEFDYSGSQALKALREEGLYTVLINPNIATIQTSEGYADAVYLLPVTPHFVEQVIVRERIDGLLLGFGGQTALNCGLDLDGVRILGTDPADIDRAEDRRKFSALCDELGIDQPRWVEATRIADLEKEVERLGGLPVIVRPSYVLSGSAMRVAHSLPQLREYLARATVVSREHPVVLSKFESMAREIDVDAVADRGEIVLWAILEHVEMAGVHSGDATLVLPPQWLNLNTIRQARKIVDRLARSLKITGPFNVQMLARQNRVKVIECNVRASRSFPFVGKVLGTNFTREATRIMLGAGRSAAAVRDPMELDHVGVKASQFSFRRLIGADPLLGVEMASTGEVGCFGDDVEDALLKAMLSTGFRFPRKGVLLALGPISEKYRFTDEARTLHAMGLRLFATPKTAEVLQSEGVPCSIVGKEERDGGTRRLGIDLIRAKEVDLVIYVPREFDDRARADGFRIRRSAVDHEVPLLTDLWLARRVVQAMHRRRLEDLTVRPMQGYRISVETAARSAASESVATA